MCVCVCVCVCVYIYESMCIYIYICVYICILLRRHVPSGLAGCCSFPPSTPVNAGHRRWLWSTECCLVSQISPTPERNHILKPLGEL